MKRSLSLCASIALLASSSMAINLKSVQLSADLGARITTIGDPTETTKLKLLGGAKATTSVASTGTVTSVTHRTPVGVVGASAVIPFSDKFGLKFVAELQVADSSTNTVYDGKSQTGIVTLDGYSSNESGSATLGGTDIVANIGVTGITAGNRKLTVDHEHAFGFKVLYAFGEHHHGASVGFGVLRTGDTYKYNCDEDPTAGANVGVFDATTIANNFQFPAAIATGAATGTRLPNPFTYTPVAGTELKVTDNVNWYGLVAEAATQYNDNLSFRGGFGYYRSTFDVSEGQTTSAPMVVESADATMYVGHVGISVKKADA